MESYGFTECADDLKRKNRLLTSLWWERHLPALAVVVSSAFLYYTMDKWAVCFLGEQKVTMASKLFDGSIGLSSIMAGFAATLIGIMFSIRNSTRIKRLDDTGHFQILKEYLLDAVDWNITLAILSIGTNVLIVKQGLVTPYCLAAVIPIFIAALLSVMRVVRLMIKLL